MTVPGLGGQQPAPQNSAPAAQLTPGVTPGSTGQVVATRVIIIGPGGELLVYSPTAGAGNLILSIAGSAGTDAFGNSFPAGLTVGPPAGPQVNIAVSGGIGRELFTPGNTAFNGGYIEGGTNGSPTYSSLALIGPQSTDPAHDDYMEETFNSANASGTSTANIQWFYVDTSGVSHEIGQANGTGWEFFGNVEVTGTLQVDSSLNVTGTLTVNGSSSTGTAGLPNGTISGTSGAASAGTAHTHGGGSYAVTSGVHSHTL